MPSLAPVLEVFCKARFEGAPQDPEALTVSWAGRRRCAGQAEQPGRERSGGGKPALPAPLGLRAGARAALARAHHLPREKRRKLVSPEKQGNQEAIGASQDARGLSPHLLHESSEIGTGYRSPVPRLPALRGGMRHFY